MRQPSPRLSGKCAPIKTIKSLQPKHGVNYDYRSLMGSAGVARRRRPMKEAPLPGVGLGECILLLSAPPHLGEAIQTVSQNLKDVMVPPQRETAAVAIVVMAGATEREGQEHEEAGQCVDFGWVLRYVSSTTFHNTEEIGLRDRGPPWNSGIMRALESEGSPSARVRILPTVRV
ncbi:hypothetical protein E2C01_050762 [Portunus trituberculatus]|uniref:Uncharacterized protein n=1 Tax=Portunus trituberculatus TaxID=210409 RepID=A0A5B7GH77_PORTR|nr:hypothetical protein [Portunus trituberculatus]